MLMATARRQMNVMPFAGMLMPRQFFRPVRMMPAAPQHQMEGEGEDREEGGEDTHRVNLFLHSIVGQEGG
jgi:hypothetical protein